MPLPTPNLDDRKFQDIVDEAKRLIPVYCPEWTDHNVSDPGIALIELFAWMTEMLLYRTNRLPDKVHIELVELLGIQLHPPRPAQAALTFELSAPRPESVFIPAGTEVATKPTDGSRPIVFATTSDLFIRPAACLGSYHEDGARGVWTSLDLGSVPVAVFPEPPKAHDSLYLRLSGDLSRHHITIAVKCEYAGGTGVDPNNPPLVWEVWNATREEWTQCTVASDSSKGFTRDGEVELYLPEMHERTLHEHSAFWLRCRLTGEEGRAGQYSRSPVIRDLSLHTRGASATARHAHSVMNEVLGTSDGSPGQRFMLLRPPILDRDPNIEYLLVEHPDGRAERWTEVEHFSASKSTDLHYRIDSMSGQLEFGPTLRQPDREGRVFQLGATPPSGARLRFTRYRTGGGVSGNLRAKTLTEMKSSIPYVASVANHEPSFGGTEGESLEHARLRAAGRIRGGERAVTVEDFVTLTATVEGVARCVCVGPEECKGEVPPGRVRVAVLPTARSERPPRTPLELTVDDGLRERILSELHPRRMVGIELEVTAPRVLWLSAKVSLVAERGWREQRSLLDITERARAILQSFFDPYLGGPEGSGWPFGRDVHLAEVIPLLQRLKGVEAVDSCVLRSSVGPRDRQEEVAAGYVKLKADMLVCSLQHEILFHRGGA